MALSDADVQKQVMLIRLLSCRPGELNSANFVEPSVIKLTIQRLAQQSSSKLDIAPCAHDMTTRLYQNWQPTEVKILFTYVAYMSILI